MERPQDRAIPMPAAARIPPFHLPWCFGCGPENEQGLRLEARIEGDLVVADIQFAPWFQGGPGVVHGGAIAAFFDDLMGFVPVAHLVPAVTAHLSIDYRRPIPLGKTVRGEAWLTERDGRKLWAQAVGIDGSGEVLIECKALYLAVNVEHFVKALDDMPAAQRERLARFHPDEYYP
ncbi:MAG: PaaI family thioesterase [Actinobacteria bacterium]|jgi:acyl-coenzyme A thioesterase PaaI-like protein|nr:PaaI family thioesterase [Actinomycetota bacterium]MBU1494957.1 PaaI family thioesterase [Actinomycetota bacterium]